MTAHEAVVKPLLPRDQLELRLECHERGAEQCISQSDQLNEKIFNTFLQQVNQS